MKKRVLTISLLALLLVLSVAFFWVTCDINNKDEEEEPKTFTVNFDTYTETKISSQTPDKDGYIKEPGEKLERAGHTFLGWYNGNKKWDFKKDKVTESITLKARWNRYLFYANAKDGSDGLWVTGCQFDVENVVIPDSHNGKKITGIHFAFAERKNLKSVVIPNTVTYISENAFAKCEGLTSVYIPNSVTVIEKGAFSLCPNLEEIRCEAESKPQGWHNDFNTTEAIVKFNEIK